MLRACHPQTGPNPRPPHHPITPMQADGTSACPELVCYYEGSASAAFVDASDDGTSFREMQASLQTFLTARRFDSEFASKRRAKRSSLESQRATSAKVDDSSKAAVERDGGRGFHQGSAAGGATGSDDGLMSLGELGMFHTLYSDARHPLHRTTVRQLASRLLTDVTATTAGAGCLTSLLRSKLPPLGHTAKNKPQQHLLRVEEGV